MPKKEFVMRGKTASGEYHTINFSGFKGDYAFRLIEFQIYPSTGAGTGWPNFELSATITADKVFEDPENPNFNHEGLIGTTFIQNQTSSRHTIESTAVINDTFLITQDLILAVIDTEVGAPMAVNWQVKFMPVKMTSTEMANANYRQFSIFDD